MSISIREFNKNITKWLNCGKQLIITKNGKPLVKLIPYVATIDKIDRVATPNKVATPIKAVSVATVKKPKPLQANPFSICPKHQVFRSSCGCK